MSPDVVRGVTAAPALLALAFVGGCRAAPTLNNQTGTAPTLPTAEPTPTQRAERLVAERLGLGTSATFAPAQTFTSRGATIVCGQYQVAGQPSGRYIAVGEEDVFVEGQMQPGHMDRAATEFCRNA